MPGGQIDLDCSQLGEAPLLVPASSSSVLGTTSPPASTPASTKPIFVGPEIDRSLLASVYNQQWIDQNISADVLEELSVDGTDAIIDACIVRGAGVRARLQTSLQYAWDPTDPRIDPALAHP